MNSTEAITHTGRRVKGLSGTPDADLSTWPHPDEGAIPEKKRALYRQRKKAIQMYLSGESKQTIHQLCHLDLKHVYRLIRERCIASHKDGRIYGWRGIVPGLHIRPYQRKSKLRVDDRGRGAAGAMQAVLDSHPELGKRFVARILTSPSKNQLGPVKRPRKAHWTWFLDELRKFGYEIRCEWPFNTRANGYHAICRFIDSVLADNPKKAIQVVGGPDLEKKMMSGDGVGRPISRIFQRVEMDGHKLDGIFCVLLPHSSGGYVPKVIHRIWVIVILEVISRAVLGYYLSLRREVNKEDVLRAIKSALSTWKPKIMTHTDLAYCEGAGFPNSISTKLHGVGWEETSVDGALAETCRHVRETLKEVVGSTMLTPNEGYASRRSKNDRPFIEAYFKNLAGRGFQRISNTTGGKAGGTDGRNPAKVAIQSEFQYEYAEELLDVLIANYNATPHSGIGYRSPLEFLRYMIQKEGTELQYADSDAVQAMLSYRQLCIVRGGLKEGKKPYVNFVGVKHTSELLGQRYDLVGTKIWVVNHIENDARVAQASQTNGMPLGILRAAPPWDKLPHSLEVRRAIQSCMHRGQLNLSPGEDAVEAFLNYCERQRNGKLPLHPAYLLIRRLLAQEGALLQENESIVVEVSKQDPSAPFNKPSIKSDTQEPSPSLPARRMAKTS